MVNLYQTPKYKYEYQFMRSLDMSLQTTYFNFFKYIKPFLQRIAYITAQDIKRLSQSCYPLAEVGGWAHPEEDKVITREQFCGVTQGLFLAALLLN